jgi:hypothetical protein
MEKSYLLKINYIGFSNSLKMTAKLAFQTASSFYNLITVVFLTCSIVKVL